MRRRTYDQHHMAALCFCAVWPIAAAYLGPDYRWHPWIGTTLVVASISQFFWLPAAYARWRTKGD